MLPVVLPAILSFLGGAAIGASLGVSRRGLSMLPPSKPSPLPGVPSASWEKFVTIMVVAPRQTRTPRGRLGMFGMDARRLADLGLMTGAHKSQIGSEVGVWTGSWRAPLDESTFLASAPIQYEAFKRSMQWLAPRVAGHLGSVVDGRRATLSGLLAAGHLAGQNGISSWVADPAVRRKFKDTTANFERANGLF
jgi:hypothetical protein